MAYCSSTTLVKREGLHVVALAVRCRSWTCIDCGDQRKRQLIAQGIGGVARTYIVLTTTNRVDHSADVEAKKIARGWRVLRLRIMRRYGWKKLPFLAVMEKHKSGWPHLNILARCGFIDWHWLKEQWRDISGSPGVKIRKITNRAILAGYCAKYCSKAAEKFATCKRYWQSRDYDLRPKPQQTFAASTRDGWVREELPFGKWCHEQLRRGWKLKWNSHWSVEARPNPW